VLHEIDFLTTGWWIKKTSPLWRIVNGIDIYVQFWIITKRRKQSPFRWFLKSLQKT